MATLDRSRFVRYQSFGAVALSLALVGTACSSPSVDDATETAVSVSGATVDLSGVSIDSSTFEELDVVRFSGIELDSDMNSLVLQGITGSLDPMDMLLFVDDQGLYTIFPLHPESPGEGGDIVLRLSLPGNERKEFEVSVAGLPPAPGAWDTAVDALTESLEARAGGLGTSLSEVAGVSCVVVDPQVAVVKLVAGYVDDGSANDLESLLDRPEAGFTAEEIDLTERITSKIGLEQLVLAPMDLTTLQALASDAQTVSDSRNTRRVNAERAVFAQSASCWPNTTVIENGDDLSDLVKEGKAASDLLNDPIYRAGDNMSSDLAAASGMIAVAGAVTGVGAAPAAAVAGPLAAVAAIYTLSKVVLKADAGKFPSKFVRLDAEVDTTVFNEDFKNRGFVESVKVTATSTGFNAADEIAGLGTSALSGLTGALAAGRSSDLPGMVDAAQKVHGLLQDTAIGKAIKEGKGFEFCGKQWTVSITSDRFIDATAVNKLIEIDSASMSYEPLEVGDDILRFKTLPDPFPGVFATTDVAVETGELYVVGEPIEVKVERAGQDVDISVRLDNADTLTLDWKTEQGSWSDGKGSETNTETTRPLETPTDRDLYPFFVVVESTSETGLRAKPRDTRSAMVKVVLQDLIVSPNPGSVIKGGQLQFFATDDEGNPREVTWTATGGDIDEDGGLYSAGTVIGTYSVTATAVDDPNATETVRVTIFEGACLLGTWLLRSQEFFDQVGAQAGGQTQFRSGESRLVIREDGTYTTFRDAWSFEVVTEDASIVGVIDAENGGTWQATDVEMTIEEAGGDEETVQLFIEVGGQLQSIPGVGTQYSFASDSFSGQYPYTCDASVLATTASGVTSTFDRVDG
jgi:hypothetical protein